MGDAKKTPPISKQIQEIEASRNVILAVNIVITDRFVRTDAKKVRRNSGSSGIAELGLFKSFLGGVISSVARFVSPE